MLADVPVTTVLDHPPDAPGMAPAEEHALAHRIAAVALATYPAARQLDTLSVTLVRGYDIGIASHRNTKTFDGPPGAWRH